MALRLTWLSNSGLTQTGYGNQTALFVPRIQKLGHALAVHAFYGCEGSMLEADGITIFPKHIDPYGNDIVGAHAQHFGADAILSLIDAWVMRPEQWNGVPWVAWAPIDSDFVHAPDGTVKNYGKVMDALRRAQVAIAYSKFGHDRMREAGIDALYVPHGVSTTDYAPMSQAEARQRMGWPTDAYVVGMVAANKGWPSRKAWPEHIAAFARFRHDHPDARLYLHTSLGVNNEYGGVNLAAIMEQYGLQPGVDVAWCDQYRNVLGFPTSDMRLVYNTFDVFMNVSCGEGFGIPAVEAQACGVPIITGDWTAQAELCFAGWLVPRTKAHPEWTPLEAVQWRPHPDGIADALVEAYRHRGDEALRQQARNGAMAYDADTVTETYWKPALEEVERRLSAPVLVAGPVGREAA